MRAPYTVELYIIVQLIIHLISNKTKNKTKQKKKPSHQDIMLSVLQHVSVIGYVPY